MSVPNASVRFLSGEFSFVRLVFASCTGLKPSSLLPGFL